MKKTLLSMTATFTLLLLATIAAAQTSISEPTINVMSRCAGILLANASIDYRIGYKNELIDQSQLIERYRIALAPFHTILSKYEDKEERKTYRAEFMATNEEYVRKADDGEWGAQEYENVSSCYQITAEFIMNNRDKINDKELDNLAKYTANRVHHAIEQQSD